jgi:4-amino-4-deoxy-L-arabinose transferase-like glycosyltransferase
VRTVRLRVTLRSPQFLDRSRTRSLDRLTGRLAPLWLVLLCLAAYLPGLFTIPPIDRDESRFAQASRQMFESVALPSDQRVPTLHSGGLAVPYVGATPRLNKPPLVYWLQAASAAAFTGGDPLRDAIWMYRVPNVLCTVGAVLLLFRFGLKMPGVGRSAAFLASAGFAACPLVVVDAHQARADQLLLLTVVATQALLWRIYAAPRTNWGLVLAFWLSIAMGVLAKGPITPLIALLTAIAFSTIRGEWRWLWRSQPLVGVLIVAAGVSPWVIAVGQHVGLSNYLSGVYAETIGRSKEAMEGHWGPPGYHAALFVFLLWPLALALPHTLTRLRRRWRRDVSVAFLLAWLLPAWLVFEVVSTKLPHYPLPLFPAAALLLARSAVVVSRVPARRALGVFLHWKRFWAGTGLVVVAAIAALGASMPWWREFGWIDGPNWQPTTGVVPAAALLGATAFVLIFRSGSLAGRHRITAAILGGIAGVVLSYWTLFRCIGPAALSLSSRVVAALPTKSSPQLIGYDEDSVLFLTRGLASRGGDASAVSRVHVGVLSQRVANDRGVSLPANAVRVRGFNIARGRCETVIVLPGALP